MIVRAGHVVSSAQSRPLPDGAILVRDGRIESVGRFDELVRKSPDARQVGSQRHIAIPGFVNAHHHGLGLTSFQLGAVDGHLETWMPELQTCALRVRDQYLNTLYSDIQLLRSGVTSVAHIGIVRRPDRCRDEIVDTLRAHAASGIRTMFSVNIRDRWRWVYTDDNEFLARFSAEEKAAFDRLGLRESGAEVDEMFDVYRTCRQSYADGRIIVTVSAEGPEWCSDDLLLRIREQATTDGVPLHIHAVESRVQTDFLRAYYGESPIQHLAALGFLGPDTSIAHAVWLTAKDIDICADRGVTVCHNPSSNLRLRNGILPLHELRKSGVTTAIGSDSTSFDDRDDYFNELRLARMLHTLPMKEGLEAPTLTPRDLFAMATEGGAHAIGQDRSIGRLDPGRQADIVLINSEALTGAYLHPSTHPIDALLYRGSRHAVDTVIVDGQVVVEGGRCTTVDEDALAEQLRESVVDDSDPEIAAWEDVLPTLRPAVAAFYAEWRPDGSTPSYLVNAPS
jgi:cytosine/adenosine deaminase-related metal-dependent hydrolase